MISIGLPGPPNKEEGLDETAYCLPVAETSPDSTSHVTVSSSIHDSILDCIIIAACNNTTEMWY